MQNFELSLFKTKSESEIGVTALNLKFVNDFETKRENLSINAYILNLQTSIVATNIPKFLESAFATLGSSIFVYNSEIPTETPFIPTIHVQLTISNEKSAVVSPPSTPPTPQTSIISSPPLTPHTRSFQLLLHP